MIAILAACVVTDKELDAALGGRDLDTDIDTDTDSDSDTDTDSDTDSDTDTDVLAGPFGIELIEVAAGTFDMGSVTGSDPEPGAEMPVHAITLTRAFRLGRAEVTQEQWETAMGPSSFNRGECEDCPAESFSWHAAAAFANAASSAEGLTPCYEQSGAEFIPPEDPYSCEGYRLPTEAEWEYAARAGESWVYAGSSDLEEVAVMGNVPAEPVCWQTPNAWGFCDMSGNVAEWVGDWYDNTWYSSSPAQDPVGSATSSDVPATRVLRGGGRGGMADDYARVDARGAWVPDEGRGDIGLRLARTVP